MLSKRRLTRPAEAPSTKGYSLLSFAATVMATAGLISLALNSQLAIPIGIVGLFIGGISIRMIWMYFVRARERRQAIKELVFKGYCPRGLEGPHKASDAFSRCKEASYAKCLMCTMTWMGEPFSSNDYKEALRQERMLEPK